MKLFIFFDSKALEIQQLNKPDEDHLGNTIAAVKAAGFKLARRQPLMLPYLMLIGDADEKAVHVLRKITNVVKVRRTDGKKFHWGKRK